MVKVISSPSAVIGDLVDLTDDLTQFCPGSEVILTSDEDFSLHLFSYFNRSQTFLCVDCLGYQTSGLNLNIHELKDV